jgi:hypothetical protein
MKHFFVRLNSIPNQPGPEKNNIEPLQIALFTFFDSCSFVGCSSSTWGGGDLYGQLLSGGGGGGPFLKFDGYKKQQGIKLNH